MIRLARLLRALADLLDPPAPAALPVALPVTDDGEVDRFCREMHLRRALHDSLRRYSPIEQPGQA